MNKVPEDRFISMNNRTSEFRVKPTYARDKILNTIPQSSSKGTVHGVAGNALVVEHGTPVALKPDSSNDKRLYPRAVVAIDRLGQKLWLIAVDGKQPLYGEGVTLPELSKIVAELGAYTALNLDGGGSTTLVFSDRSGVHTLNAPIHAKLPMRQRPIANHIGFFAYHKE